MKISNELKISFKSLSRNESLARSIVSAFASQLDPSITELADIKTAVSEAVTNSIVHGYRNAIGPIYITLRVIEDDTLYIKIRDVGCGIENITKAMEPLYTTSPNDERSGIGFSIMESFMTSLRVYSVVGRGTTVVMTKKIEAKLRAN